MDNTALHLTSVHTYMKQGWPEGCSKSEESGGEVQGGKREPCSFETARSMIFSRVVNSRSDMGSLSSIASFTDSLTDLIKFSIGSSSGEVTGVVRPDMMEMRGPCTLGEVV